jgi:hypothetical protein
VKTSNNSKVPSFLAGVLVALLLGTGGAYAATGGNFLLGKSNSATKTTTLKNTKGTPLALSGKGAPLKVSSKTKVANLNTDLIDGLDSSAFARSTGKTGAFDFYGTAVDLDGNGLADALIGGATCPAGTQATGGGVTDLSATGIGFINAPDTEEAWLGAVLINEGSGDTGTDLIVSVVCYSPNGTRLTGSYKPQAAKVTTAQVRVVKRYAAARDR